MENNEGRWKEKPIQEEGIEIEVQEEEKGKQIINSPRKREKLRELSDSTRNRNGRQR